MKRSEIFNVLVDKVCEICEVDKEDLLGKARVQPVVDARVLAFQYLRRIGFSNDDIAEMLLRHSMEQKPTQEQIKKKAKGVDKTFSSYSNRCLQSYSFCLMSKDVRDYCRETYKDMYVYGMKQLPD